MEFDVSPEEDRQRATAYHEAGHAVMAFIVGRQLQKVTIAPRNLSTGGIRLGACQIRKVPGRGDREDFEGFLLYLLAGMVAESHLTQRYCEEGAAHDLQIFRRMLQRHYDHPRQRERWERRLLQKAEFLLQQPLHQRAIERIAAALLANTTISGRAALHLFEMTD